MDKPTSKLGQVNPFNVTKAVDFTDQQIADYWVDYGDDGIGFLEMAKPTSPMPMLILGGKGSGKTHLMRYLSFNLQKIRHPEGGFKGMQNDGFIGIYFRCGGLNAARFNGKGIDDEIWASVFAYYMELWFAQLVLETLCDAASTEAQFAEREAHICAEIINLFDKVTFVLPADVKTLIRTLNELQKEVNVAVNNSSLSRKLEVNILVTPGQLTFGVPKILSGSLDFLKDIQFLYLIDEFENIAESQQKYINTLYREKEGPCSFKIGSKLYGIKTNSTLSAGEENKEGSEYEILYLDALLRKGNKKYSEFSKRLCKRRLTEFGYPSLKVEEYFEQFEEDKYADDLINNLTSSKKVVSQPYFETLSKQLLSEAEKRYSKTDASQITGRIVENLRVPGYPLLEKLNTFLLYQDWASKKDLIVASEEIALACREHLSGIESKRYISALDHFKSDLIAQLVRDYDHKQPYLGLDTFIEMSDGLPRNLLVILKHIFKWAVFNGEHPFYKGTISIESQNRGVREAAEWFYHDARMTGVDGEIVKSAVDRLARLFREVRFSDKPSECSVSSFSTDISECSIRAREVVDLAEKWSLLIRIEGGQRHRNTKRVDAKYQINSMLAPRWDLPIGRRGALDLAPTELNSIFDSQNEDFDLVLKKRVARMKVPFTIRSKNLVAKETQVSGRLPGIDLADD